ncbi:hypothetical protein HAX54_030448, partial [Datura stramonium]|nr:hypothetical protein [Datura stramonium]
MERQFDLIVASCHCIHPRYIGGFAVGARLTRFFIRGGIHLPVYFSLADHGYHLVARR